MTNASLTHALTDDDLDAELAELEETRKTAEREVEALRSRWRARRAAGEEQGRLIRVLYVGMVPEALESLTPEERHGIYKMFRLGVAVNAGGEIEVTGDLMAGPEVCNTGPAPWRSWGKS